MTAVRTVWPFATLLAGIFGGALLCLPFTRRMPWRSLLIAAAYLMLDHELLVHAPRVHALQWNWIGKLGSLVLGFAAMGIFQLSRADAGLRKPQPGSWWWVWGGLAVSIGLELTQSHHFHAHHASVETFLYQAVMTGVAEEFTYRGVAYAMLLRGFGGKGSACSNLAAIVITSCCFALAHLQPLPVSLPASFLSFVLRADAFVFASMFGFSLPLGIVRWRTGSLLGPVLSHGGSNVTGILAAQL